MNLPIPLEYPPMEADTAKTIPTGADWQYEPKWDGFRCLAFSDGDFIAIRSKSGQTLERYFPEVVESLGRVGASKFVLDGELVVPDGANLSFNALLQRIHPAESRIRKLSRETPAQAILFDMLVDEHGDSLVDKNLSIRRPKLDAFAHKYLQGNAGLHLSPYTCDIEVAKGWFHNMTGGLDGIIAKRLDLPYQSGNREGMLKIKNLRTADCVVGGFRYGSKEKLVGSLLLGLYDDGGLLHHVGFTSGLAAADKADLTDKLEKLIQKPGFTGAAPGGPSRWSTERSTEWQPLRAELVVEVQYDHFAGGRFRHGTKLLRWRPDKDPRSCKIGQVQRESESPLTLLDKPL